MTISSILAGQSTLLTFTAFADGTQTDLGTLTVGIVDADGTTVVTAGTSVTDNSDGTYTYQLASQANPKFLIATWTFSGGPVFTTYYDVQTSLLFDEYSLRNFDDGAVGDSSYTDAEIAQVHQQTIEHMEAATGRSWIRRYNRAELQGSGSCWADLETGVYRTSTGLTLYRPGANLDVQRILSADDGTTITPSDISIYPDGILYKSSAWASSSDPFNVTVEYEYGLPHAVDGADRIAMVIARHRLVSSRIPDSAASYNDGLGTFTFTPGKLPWEAWQWLNDHKTQGFFA